MYYICGMIKCRTTVLQNRLNPTLIQSGSCFRVQCQDKDSEKIFSNEHLLCPCLRYLSNYTLGMRWSLLLRIVRNAETSRAQVHTKHRSKQKVTLMHSKFRILLGSGSGNREKYMNPDTFLFQKNSHATYAQLIRTADPITRLTEISCN